MVKVAHNNAGLVLHVQRVMADGELLEKREKVEVVVGKFVVAENE